MRRKTTGTLRRFVARAISDASKRFYRNGRVSRIHAHTYAEAAIAAVKRGKARGLR